MKAFWHDPTWNSWHEDFHLLLGVADACFLTMAIDFLDLGSSRSPSLV
jgi:hypothetical protein